jgi:hypothetical protein
MAWSRSHSPILIGIDLGTTICKALVFDQELNLLGSASKQLSLVTLSGNEIEQDAREWWIATQEVVREALQKEGCDPRSVKGLSVSSQGISFVPVDGSGASEALAPNPPGEYAQSCVGRERLFEYFSRKYSTPGRLFRLNYAIDMRYGVLHDIATKVLQGKPIDVSLGHVNFIWQGDASAQALRCLAHCDTPTSPINVSGHEILAVRDLAAKLGRRLGRDPIIVGREEPTAWLTDTSQATKLFGLPIVGTEQLIAWTADWVARAMPSLGKPTKYEVRDGRY